MVISVGSLPPRPGSPRAAPRIAPRRAPVGLCLRGAPPQRTGVCRASALELRSARGVRVCGAGGESPAAVARAQQGDLIMFDALEVSLPVLERLEPIYPRH